jgi:Flp pilus assembly secretin CpaC
MRGFILIALLAGLAAPVAGLAQQQRMISVVANRAELFSLDQPAGSILVANPAIADVVIEGGNRLFVLGRAPGETQVFVLDGQGKTLINALVSVRPPSANHITVFRGTEESNLHCSPRCAATGVLNVSPIGGAATGSPPPAK